MTRKANDGAISPTLTPFESDYSIADDSLRLVGIDKNDLQESNSNLVA